MLEVDHVPERLVVLGGGVIGCEFASIFAHFGSHVTIVEMLPNLLGNEDADAVSALERAFKKRGVDVVLGARATRVEPQTDSLRLIYADGNDEEHAVEADRILVSTGRVANVEDLGLEAAGVIAERRRIPVDASMRTNVPHIFAAGDVAGNWQLAHTAFREGEVAAENACGHDAVVDNRAVPRPIYTHPEVAGVGLTEAQAREEYGDEVAVGRFPWVANARAVMQDETVGWVKSIHETRYGELLGVVIVGPHATDLIEAGVVAIDAEATVETVADGMAPHPTLSEGIKEAGLVALGRAIHLPNRKPRAAAAS
jgi:dihydrolipoamide dehydrogenase